MIKIKKTKVIDCQDWDELVQKTYGKPYSLQQQDGCMDRGKIGIDVPSTWAEQAEEEMHDKIPEVINNEEEMGVKFDVWLARDPNQPLNPSDKELSECNYYWGKTEEDALEWKKDESNIELFFERNFYPSLETLIDDLHKKGLIEEGDYQIDIDW
jgi:hypothetical protein